MPGNFPPLLAVMPTTQLSGAWSLVLLSLAAWATVRMLLRLRRRLPGGDVGLLVLTIISHVLLGVAWYALLRFWMEQNFAVLVWLIGLAVYAFSASQRHLASQNLLLLVIAVAVERRMPLGAALTSYAEECQGWVRYRIAKLVRLLEQGQELGQALQAVRVVPREALMSLHVGQALGQLPETIGTMIQHRTSYRRSLQNVLAQLWYLSVLLLVALVVFLFFCVKVAPALRYVADDFDMALPTVVTTVFAAGDQPAAFWLLVFLVFTQLTLLLHLLLYFLGWVDWKPPGLGRLTRGAEVAVLLRQTGSAMRHQQPLDVVWEMWISYFSGSWLRRRLQRCRESLSAGNSWLDTMVDEQLLSATDAALVAAASRAGNIPWALNEAAQRQERRVDQRIVVLARVLNVLLLLPVVGIVLLMAIVVYIPTLKIIESLT